MADVGAEFDGFVTQSRSRLVQFAYQLTHDRFTAEDLVHEVFMNMYAAWRSNGIPELAHPEAYLRRCVANEYLRRRRLRASGEILRRDHSEEESVPDFSQQVVNRDAIWRALARLPKRQRVALVLKYFEDLPDPEIAVVLGCSDSTVRSLIARGLSRLRPAAERGGLNRLAGRKDNG